jgi:hypothetical protein
MLAKGDMARSVWKPQLTRHLRLGWLGVYQGGQRLSEAGFEIRPIEAAPSSSAQNALIGRTGRARSWGCVPTTEKFRAGDLNGLSAGGLRDGIVHAAIFAQTFRKGRRFRGAEFL